MIFVKTKNFEKNLKSLRKRFLIDEALEILEMVLEQSPKPYGSTPIDGLGDHITLPVIKMNLKCENVARSRFRIVYAYNEDMQIITFIEVYFKGDKENHDQELIKAYFKTEIGRASCRERV